MSVVDRTILSSAQWHASQPVRLALGCISSVGEGVAFPGKLAASPTDSALRSERRLERVKGFEPSTFSLATRCSTTELHPR